MVITKCVWIYLMAIDRILFQNVSKNIRESGTFKGIDPISDPIFLIALTHERIDNFIVLKHISMADRDCPQTGYYRINLTMSRILLHQTDEFDRLGVKDLR